MALYTDRAHWAFHTPKANGPVDKTPAHAGRAGAGAARHRAHPGLLARKRAAAVSGSIARSRIGWSTSCAWRGSPRSRRPIAYLRDRLPAAAQRDVQPAAARPGERVRPARARSISSRSSVTRRTRVVGPRQHRHARRVAPADRAAAGPAHVRRPRGHRPPPPRRAVLDLARRPAAGHASTPTGQPVDAAAPVDGRTEPAAHEPLGQPPRTRRPTAPTGVTLDESGQITCQTKADRFTCQQHVHIGS